MSSTRTQLAILGSTGTIGKQTLDIVRENDSLEVYALSAHSNVQLLAEQVKEFAPQVVVISDEQAAERFDETCPGEYSLLKGEEGLATVAAANEVQIVVAGIMGFAALGPVYTAIRAKKGVALANKEVLVGAGAIISEEIKHSGAFVVPVDSEHNAVYQCLSARAEQPAKITLTASGGPFRGRSLESFSSITPEEALQHPNWNMGAKISIDSATMVNKALEVIEAHWLFDIPAGSIDVLLHPQSIVHGLVEYRDGSVVAALSQPDMRFPIAHALETLSQTPLQNSAPRLNLAEAAALEFARVDEARYPALKLAYQALEQGGAAGLALNAANEVAVSAFLAGELSFSLITEVCSEMLALGVSEQGASIEQILELDSRFRREAAKLCQAHGR